MDKIEGKQQNCHFTICRKSQSQEINAQVLSSIGYNNQVLHKPKRNKKYTSNFYFTPITKKSPLRHKHFNPKYKVKSTAAQTQQQIIDNPGHSKSWLNLLLLLRSPCTQEEMRM
jgi:uncharacterized protein (DUF1919 family)